MKTKIRCAAAGRLALLALAVVYLQPPTLPAAPGDLDLSFGDTGKVTTGFGGGYSVAYAAAVQSDGKLILAGYGNGRYTSVNNYGKGGDFLLARFTTNNLLDPAFGEAGKVLTRVSTNYPRPDSSVIRAVKVQADGKIIVGGWSFQKTNYADFTLARYNADGSLDTAFGTNGTGVVHTDFGQFSQINAMAIQANSNIVVAGFISTDGYTSAGFALARYDINGVLDPSFGSGGKVTTPGTRAGANAMLIQPDGKIVAVGTGNPTDGYYNQFAVFRYTTNGVLDPTFNGTGKVFTSLSPLAYDYAHSANAVALQFGTEQVGNPDKLVVAGTYQDEHTSPDQFFQTVLRYNLDGSLDGTFGSGGIVTNAIIPQNPFGQFCTGLIVQGLLNQPRKITIAGWGTDGTNRVYSLARFTAGGAFDTSFGTNSSGKILLRVASNSDQEAAAYALALQAGQFVIAGNLDFTFSESYFAAARFTSSGAVDGTFGNNGLLLANLSDAPGAQANAVALQPDGKIVAAGATPPVYDWPNNRNKQSFAVARFNDDGSLDGTFGAGGKAVTVIGSNDLACAVAVQPDGKIVAAGKSFYAGKDRFAVARYHPDGTPDSSFGNNGAATVLVGDDRNQANALRIQSDGKILVAGFAESGSYTHFALARFNTNGTLDGTFGGGGTVLTTFSLNGAEYAYGLGMQSDGKIVAGGLAAQVNGSTITVDFGAARYSTNGGLDLSFGSFGRVTTNVGGGTLDVGYALAVQPDGKIIVAGGAGLGGLPGPVNNNQSVNAFLALVRFNTNGTLDGSFGPGGSVVTQVGPYSDFATSIALQPDGKILVAGASQNGLYKFFTLRYTTNGAVDASYGNGGTALVDFGSGTNEFAYGLALDSFGRAVLAGDAGGAFGLARLEGDFVASPSLTIFLTPTNTAVIAWPFPSTGWELKMNTNLVAGYWDVPSETINNDGTNKFIIVNPPAGNRFYRLYKP
jgi:uncharacterized delta-60 repeat protein